MISPRPGESTSVVGKWGWCLVVGATKVKVPLPGSHSVEMTQHAVGAVGGENRRYASLGAQATLVHWQAQKREGERMSAVI